jgi:hypothetical protein
MASPQGGAVVLLRGRQGGFRFADGIRGGLGPAGGLLHLLPERGYLCVGFLQRPGWQVDQLVNSTPYSAAKSASSRTLIGRCAASKVAIMVWWKS